MNKKINAKRVKAILLTSILILSIFAVAVPLFAQPPYQEVWVDYSYSSPSAPHYLTIQEGVAAVDAGGTVYVADGAYTGDVIVTVLGITIKGESLGAILTGGFKLQADDITVDGLTIIQLLGQMGIYTAELGPTSGTKGHKIINNEIIGPGTESGWGICISIPYFAPVETYILVDNNKIHGGWSCGIIVEGHDNIITNNEVYGNKKGIELTHTNNNVIMYNDIHDNRLYGFGCPPNSPSLVGNVINHNNIYDGIEWNSESELDASLNWWGTKIQSEITDMISGLVDFNPWLPANVETSFSDVDGDEFTYYEEVVLGTDPYDKDDHPGATIEYYHIEDVAEGEGKVEAIEEVIEVNYYANDETTITVVTYEEIPEEEPTFSALETYIDVRVDEPENLDSITIKLLYDDPDPILEPSLIGEIYENNLRMYYWDGSEWTQCSDTGVDMEENYIWAMLDSTTTPDLSYLSGGEFGGGEVKMELDKKVYHIGEEVTIMIHDNPANIRPFRLDTIYVVVSSDIDMISEIPLVETDVNTGIFTGIFWLSENASANQLVVMDGNTVTVDYEGVVGTAIVDNIPPDVLIVEPEDGAKITDTTPLIKATVSEVTIAWMTLDGIMRDSFDSGETILIYQVPAIYALGEGLHIVIVTAKDEAGNINITEWSFTVDTEEPLCSITMNPESPLNAKYVEFTFEFNEDMLDSEPILNGNATDYMILDTGDWVDERTYFANYLVKPTPSLNGTVLIDLAGALDIAGNEIEANTTFYIDTVNPTAPGNLNAKTLVSSIVLDWDTSEDLGSGMARYNIYRNSAKIGSIEAQTTTFIDPNLYTAQTYEYTIGAVDLAGNEEYSKELLVKYEPGDITEYTINLDAGWNLISLPLIPDDPSIETMLADISVDKVWMYKAEWATDGVDNNGDGEIDESTEPWLSYAPGAPPDLIDMVDGEGYWADMIEVDTLDVSGVEFVSGPVLPPTYHVVEGWNLIGFKSTISMDDEVYLRSIDDDYAQLYGYNPETDSFFDVFGDATDMEPGYGYWIYMTAEGDIATAPTQP